MLISIVNEVGGEKDFICVIQLFVLILLLFFVVLFKTDFSSCYNQILNYVSRCKLTKYGFLLFHVMVIMMAMAGIFYGICDQENTEGSYFQQGLEICYPTFGTSRNLLWIS